MTGECFTERLGQDAQFGMVEPKVTLSIKTKASVGA